MEKCSAVIIGVGPEAGLGATLAKYFAKKGLHVYIAGRHEERLEWVANGIRKSGCVVTTIVADATVEYDVIHLFKIVQQSGHRVDIAVYNVDSNIPSPIFSTLAPWNLKILWSSSPTTNKFGCSQKLTNNSMSSFCVPLVSWYSSTKMYKYFS